MTWKDPPQLKTLTLAQRVKLHPEFRPDQLFRTFRLNLLAGQLFISVGFLVAIYLKTQDWNSWFTYLVASLIIGGLMLFAAFAQLGLIILSQLFEATYSAINTGIWLQRAFTTRRPLWRYIVKLEVLPHPLLAKVGIIRTAEGMTFRPPVREALERYRLLNIVSALICREHVEEIPFEVGKIDVDAIIALHKKYGPK